jgi:hypothetical protein
MQLAVMPAYVAWDRDVAARNSEEAAIEYLVSSRCNNLVHNVSSLARTVLLKVPGLPPTNTHAGPWRRPTRPRRTRTRPRRTLFRLRDRAFLVAELFEPGQFKAGWPDWSRNGHVEVAPGSGEARVTVSDTLFRWLPIDSSITYRYSLEAFAEEPGATLRLQINWHDASGGFIGTTIELRDCVPRWLLYSQDMKPPSGAKSGMVIVGAHTSTPVLVRRASLKRPRGRKVGSARG